MGFREDLLPVFNELRDLPNDFGLNRYAVKVRVRTYQSTIGDTDNPVVNDTAIEPRPKVELQSPNANQMSGNMMSGGTVFDRYFKVSSITPKHSAGGYTPQQLKPAISPNQDLCYVLTGDDGVDIECTLVEWDFSGAFGYKLTLQSRAHGV